jgi:DNA-binding MarR family transcriptional regulator
MVRSRTKSVKPDSSAGPHPKPNPDDPSTTPADENVLFALWSTARAVTGLLDAALAPAGLTADEFAVYSLLTARDQITPTELARWMSAPPTTISSYVQRFARRGHVERVAHPTDRRSYSIRLTEAGRAAHRAAGARFLPALQAVDAALGSADGSVLRSLQRLREAVLRVAP